MSTSKDIIFTHKDLDGVASYLTLSWILGYKPAIYPTTPATMRDNVLGWLKNNKFTDYRKVFFLDLDTSELGDLIDVENVVVIDHHATNTFEYKRAKTKIENYTSCAKLLKDTLGKNVEFTDPQRVLIVLADDYDSASNKTPISYELNIVFHATTDKINSFIENYSKGFKPFDKFQKNMINLYINSRDEFLNSKRDVYSGSLPTKDGTYKVVSAISNDYIQELAEHLLKKHESDIVFIIMPRGGKVSIRKKDSCKMDLSKLAEKLCDGGGHACAAGGSAMTESFQMFSGTLNLI